MAKYEYGDRIGRTARLMVGASAIIFDESRQKSLLTRRTDNGRWCLPGGQMDSGESVEETCIREVQEETGLEVRVTKLVGVYSTPHRITTYADGNRWQIVGISFIAERTGGTLGLSNETTEVGFFTQEEIAAMDVLEPHRERIKDALTNQEAAFFREKMSERRLNKYQAAGGVLHHQGKLLLLRKLRVPELRLPKGHIEPGETPEEAALREVGEEGGYTGLKVVASLGTGIAEFDLPTRPEHIVREDFFFLLEAVGPEPIKQERDEDDRARFAPLWLSFDEALAGITFEAEHIFIQRAVDYLTGVK
jgi:8-oxo-dGTP pyrophosphatase MutT (NUDIX family)